MTAISKSWRTVDNPLAPDSFEFKVPAKPANAIWTRILDYVAPPVTLRISASGTWKPVDFLAECGADGFRHWVYDRSLLLMKKAPLGALIGKIGGSDSSEEESEIFLVGSSAVITYTDLQKTPPFGPLYLTINDTRFGLEDNTGVLTVKCEVAD